MKVGTQLLAYRARGKRAHTPRSRLASGSPGKVAEPPRTTWGGQLGSFPISSKPKEAAATPISYEVMSYRIVRGFAAEGAQAIVVPTNTWSFGAHAATAEQQTLATRMRALELGLRVVQSAPSGISAIVDPRGRGWRAPRFIKRRYFAGLSHSTGPRLPTPGGVRPLSSPSPP